MIQLQQVVLQRGQRILLQQANLTIHAGQKVGIVGANGCGKSSLFALLQGKLSADRGELILPKGSSWAHIQQEMPSGTISAINYTLKGDVELDALQAKLKLAEQAEDGMAIAAIHSRMAEIDAYSAPSRAAKILVGLGFSQSELEKSLGDFSGGWRMRLNLARVLIARADLLLLDEPTNHLDLEAILWLEEWLQLSSQTLLLISHDREFLDRVITHTVYFHNKQLENYVGNYSAFEKQRAEQLAVQQATYVKQQRSRAHMQKFVDRFRAKATKAKQAQSRIKMLEKIQWLAPVLESSPFHFEFKPVTAAGRPMLQLREVSVGYGSNDILQHVSCAISDGDRIGLMGPNGAGKSTLIKVLARKLTISSGELIGSNKVKIGYFAQHQLEQLDLNAGALQHLQAVDRVISESQGRHYLGGFNFRNDDVFRPVKEFSGGEKARLVLALLIWQAPNLLLLDEPTNHLDLEMREVLTFALQKYEGAMVIVSHDRYLLKSVTNEIWLVTDKRVQSFAGDVDDYRQWHEDRQQFVSKGKTQTTKKVTARSTEKHKRSLQKQLDKLENDLVAFQIELRILDQQLSQADLYLTQGKDKVTELTVKREELTNRIAATEEQILMLMQTLEEQH